MLEIETLIVFRILGVLAQARHLERALVLDEIAQAAHLARPHAERYMTLLEQAGAVRAEGLQPLPSGYSLTNYGLQRLSGSVSSMR